MSTSRRSPRRARLMLASGFGVLLALMAALIFFGVDQMDRMSRNILSLERTAHQKTHIVFEMREAIRKRSYSLVLTPTLKDFFDRDAERERFHSYERDYIIARDKLLAFDLTEKEKNQIDTLQSQLRRARGPVVEAMHIAVEDEEPWPAIQAAVTAQRDMIDSLNELVNLIAAGTKKRVQQSAQAYENIRDAARVLGLAVLLTGLVIAGFVVARETRKTRELVDEIFLREKSEADARNLNDLLEKKVSERTAELRRAVDALRAARDEAETANLTKSQFLATMSHELRTPLNAIIGFSDAIERSVFGPLENPRYKGYVTDINQSGRHLLELINDILDISVIEVGEMELNPEPVAAKSLAETSIRLVRPSADSAGIVLQATIADNLPEVLADERRAKQILVNLLSNAVKFTPPGGIVSLDVSSGQKAATVTFTVRDTGIGMNQADLEKSLRKFGQADSELARKYEGTGLGLPLAKELTELHGGAFDVQSTPGKGTIVTVTLPAGATVPLRIVAKI